MHSLTSAMFTSTGRPLRSRGRITRPRQGDEIGSRYYLHSRNAADAVLFILRHKQPYMHQDGALDRPECRFAGEGRVGRVRVAADVRIGQEGQAPWRFTRRAGSWQ